MKRKKRACNLWLGRPQGKVLISLPTWLKANPEPLVSGYEAETIWDHWGGVTTLLAHVRKPKRDGSHLSLPIKKHPLHMIILWCQLEDYKLLFKCFFSTSWSINSCLRTALGKSSFELSSSAARWIRLVQWGHGRNNPNTLPFRIRIDVILHKTVKVCIFKCAA